MQSLSDLYQELSQLPKGTLVKKTIKGTPRFYLQWREGTRLVNRYVKSADKETLEKQILRRHEIEKEIAELEEKLPRPLLSLSQNAKRFTGTLLSGDRKVAIFKEGRCLWFDEKRAPLLIKRNQNIDAFLSGRVVDQQRRNSRLLKKVLSLKETDDALLALYSYGASLTDDYWFRPRGCKKHYQDIAFQNDAYANVALNGEISFLPRHRSPSPQLSLGGSYEKCWKRIDGLAASESRGDLCPDFWYCFICFIISFDCSHLRMTRFTSALVLPLPLAIRFFSEYLRLSGWPSFIGGHRIDDRFKGLHLGVSAFVFLLIGEIRHARDHLGDRAQDCPSSEPSSSA
jgi:hypothetical protein